MPRAIRTSSSRSFRAGALPLWGLSLATKVAQTSRLSRHVLLGGRTELSAWSFQAAVGSADAMTVGADKLTLRDLLKNLAPRSPVWRSTSRCFEPLSLGRDPSRGRGPTPASHSPCIPWPASSRRCGLASPGVAARMAAPASRYATRRDVGLRDQPMAAGAAGRALLEFGPNARGTRAELHES